MSNTAEQRRLRQQRQELLDRQVIAGVRKGHTTGVTALLAAGASVNGSPDLNFPPIVHAAGVGNASMISFLVGNGANVNIGTVKPIKSFNGTEEMVPGCRALHVALRGGHVEAYRTLLKAGANPNAADSEGHTSVMAICNTDKVHAAQRVEALRELLEAGGDSCLADIYGRTAMHFAASREDGTGLIDALWSSSPSTLSKPDLEGITPLALAAYRDRPRSIAHLLSLGATQPVEFNQMPIGLFGTPLVAAVVGNHASCVDALLAAGVELNGGPEGLAHAIGAGVVHRRTTLPRLLEAFGEEGKNDLTSFKYGTDGSLLHMASALGNVAAVSVLLAAGADETAVDPDGRTAADRVGESEGEEDWSPAEDAACRRTLERAPAFRALSWSFPAETSNAAVACGPHGGGLGVRIFRPRKRTFLIRHVGRREKAAPSGLGGCEVCSCTFVDVVEVWRVQSFKYRIRSLWQRGLVSMSFCSKRTSSNTSYK